MSVVQGPLVDPAVAPPWLAPLVSASTELDPATMGRLPAPGWAACGAAVLVLFGEGPAGPDVLLVQQAPGPRHHAGQVGFPGGRTEAADADEVATALREAVEETGLDPCGVRPLAVLPRLFIPPSGFVVTPVLAHWQRPVAVAPVDPGEITAVLRVPVADLVDPANRFRVYHPSGVVGPAFGVAGVLVWGFTAGLLARLLELGGWARPWDGSDVRELDVAEATARATISAGTRPAGPESEGGRG